MKQPPKIGVWVRAFGKGWIGQVERHTMREDGAEALAVVRRVKDDGSPYEGLLPNPTTIHPHWLEPCAPPLEQR